MFKIYYINLNHRTDRRAHIEDLLKKSNLFSISERIDAIKNELGHIGCVLSHIKTLELFIESGDEYSIILEDDFITDTPDKLKDDIFKIFNDGVDFDLIQLAGNHINLTDSEYPYLKRVYDSQTTSGYIINRKFANILLNNFKESYNLISKFGRVHEYCLDIYWKSLQPISKWYCFYPTLGYQMDGYSDIEKNNVSYKC